MNEINKRFLASNVTLLEFDNATIKIVNDYCLNKGLEELVCALATLNDRQEYVLILNKNNKSSIIYSSSSLEDIAAHVDMYFLKKSTFKTNED